MISEHSINLSIDIALHVLILFTFLTIFFFVYITKLEKQSINDITSSVIEEKTNTFLDQLDNWNKKLQVGDIDWKKLDKITENLKQNYTQEAPAITQNNNRLLRNSIIIIVVIFVVLNGVILYLNLFTTYKIHMMHIVITNIIIFSITGAIEYLFFMNVASKYIPVTPDYTANTVLDRVKYNINK